MDGVFAQIRARRKVIEVEDDVESHFGSLVRQSSGRSIGSERLKRLHSLRKLSNRSLSNRSLSLSEDQDPAQLETKGDDEEEQKDNLNSALGESVVVRRKSSSKSLLSTHSSSSRRSYSSQRQPPPPPPPPPESLFSENAAEITGTQKNRQPKFALPSKIPSQRSVNSVDKNNQDSSSSQASLDRNPRTASNASSIVDIPSPPPSPDPSEEPTRSVKDRSQLHMQLTQLVTKFDPGESANAPSPPPTPLEAEIRLQKHFSRSNSPQPAQLQEAVSLASTQSTGQINPQLQHNQLKPPPQQHAANPGIASAAPAAAAPVVTTVNVIGKEEMKKILQELSHLKKEVKQSQNATHEIEAARNETTRFKEAKNLLQTQVDALRMQLKDSQTCLDHERELKKQLQGEVEASRAAVVELKEEIQKAHAREETLREQAEEIERLKEELQRARSDAKKVVGAIASMVGGERTLHRLLTEPRPTAVADLTPEEESQLVAQTNSQNSTQRVIPQDSIATNPVLDKCTLPHGDMEIHKIDRDTHLEIEKDPYTRGIGISDGENTTAIRSQEYQHLIQWTHDTPFQSAVISTVSQQRKEISETAPAPTTYTLTKQQYDQQYSWKQVQSQEGWPKQDHGEAKPVGGLVPPSFDDFDEQPDIFVNEYHRKYASQVEARVDHLRNALEHARRREQKQSRLLKQVRRKSAYEFK